MFRLFKDQLGRSMVEMLGVLAIIGVLSVGGIAGYNKAIFKYRLNKQAEQINTLITTTSRYYKDFQKESSVPSLVFYFIKMGEIPEDMIIYENVPIAGDGTPVYIFDAFNLAWRIWANSNNSGIAMTSSSTLASTASPLLSKTTESFEICKNVILAVKENSADITYFSTLTKDSNEGTNKSHTLYGNSACSKNSKCLKDLTLDDIYKICTDQFSDSGEFSIYWSF